MKQWLESSRWHQGWNPGRPWLPATTPCHSHTATAAEAEKQGTEARAWEKRKYLSCVRLFATPWTVARQAPLSMEFSRPGHWSGYLFASPRDLPNPGIKPRSPALQANSLPCETPRKPKDLEWVVYPFSRRSSRPRNRTGVACIAGGSFTN